MVMCLSHFRGIECLGLIEALNGEWLITPTACNFRGIECLGLIEARFLILDSHWMN